MTVIGLVGRNSGSFAIGTEHTPNSRLVTNSEQGSAMGLLRIWYIRALAYRLSVPLYASILSWW